MIPANSPYEVLLAFLQITYEDASTCAKWHRNALEHQKILAAVLVELGRIDRTT